MVPQIIDIFTLPELIDIGRRAGSAHRLHLGEVFSRDRRRVPGTVQLCLILRLGKLLPGSLCPTLILAVDQAFLRQFLRPGRRKEELVSHRQP